MIALTLLSACGPRVDEVPEHMLMVQNLDGQATLKRLFKEGHLRAATQADVDAYNHAATLALPEGRPPYLDPWLEAPRAFVLLKPFKVTPDMGYLTLRQIIVPAGVEANDDPNPLFSYYYLADGRCNVVGGLCPGAPKYDPDRVARQHVEERRREAETAKDAALTSEDRDQGNWAESNAGNENARPSGPLDQFTE